MLWILLSLITGLIYASVNTIDRFLLTNWIKKAEVSICILGMANVLFLAAILLISPPQPIAPEYAILAALSGALFVAYIYFYFRAVQIEEITRVGPLLYLSPVFVGILSSLFLGETLTIQQYAGVGLIVFGSLLISSKDGAAIKPGKALMWMVLCCLAMAGQLVITKYLLEFSDYWTIFFYGRVGAILVIAPVFARNLPDLKETVSRVGWKAVALVMNNEIWNMVGVLLLTVAMVAGPATLVQALTAVQLIFLLVFASVLSLIRPGLIDERVDHEAMVVKLACSALVIVGVFLIT